MPATIVETNSKKLKRKDIDPITLDIIENAMMNARYEMDAVVFFFNDPSTPDIYTY